jgi:peptide/nickel transport system substrate-binding protein
MKMQRVYFSFAVALILALWISACGPVATPETEESPPTAVTAPTEPSPTESTEEGAIPTEEEAPAISENIGTFAFSGVNFEFDPSLVLSIDHNPALQVYEHLVYWDPDKGLIPGVAESWESNEDATQWTFHIYEGVKCHDGSDFTTADVKFSIERTIAAGALTYQFVALDTIDIVDDTTIVFNMKYPHYLPNTFTDGWGQFMMCVSVGDKSAEWFGEGNGIGTGPYKYESYVPGERLVLTRNEEYRGGWREGQFTKIVYEIAEDPAVREQMLRSGQADVSVYIPFDSFQSLEATGEITPIAFPAFAQLIFFSQTDKPPIDNLAFRQALAYAFPYDDVASGTFGGFGTVSKGAVPRNMWQPPTEPVGYSYDLEKAKDLIAESGVATPIEIRIGMQSGNRDIVLASELWQSELAKIGVTATIQELSTGAFWGEVYDPETGFDVLAFPMHVGHVTPNEFLGALYNGDWTWFPFTHWNNPEYNSLLNEALQKEATDKPASDAIYAQAEKILMDDSVAVWALDIPEVLVHRNDIQGYRPNPLYSYDFFWYNATRE